jgi:Uma2 family endonuclease
MATAGRSARVERRLFTVEEYERMAEAGVLREDTRVELIGGEVVRLAAMGRRHARCVRELTRQLTDQLRGRAARGGPNG